MSHKLISLNPDLKKLRDEGYEIEIRESHILVYNVPYVNAQKKVARGMLVSPLGDMAGDKTTKPSDHVIFFAGEHPCDKDGNIIKGIRHASKTESRAGVEVNHSFSNKPTNGYSNYYEKISTYVKIIEGHAQAIDRAVTARTFKVIESNGSDTPFRYIDTNSSRADIQTISDKLKNLKIAIIGLGGTGSYILDFVAKTPVKEIHLFDEDGLLSHNAFRAPGAVSIEMLREQPKKVSYLQSVYNQIRDFIFSHAYHLNELNLDELKDVNFVFICIDEGEIKKLITEKLIALSIPFIDVGIGVDAIDGSLAGSIRTTTVTQNKRDHVDRRISFSDEKNDVYHKNIQIAELNALNAALAVIKWKKLFGFYHDQEKEYNAIYDINLNTITNDENIT